MLPARVFALIVAFVTGSVARAGAQLPFRVPNVTLEPDAREQQKRAYRSEANSHEVLSCVASWERTVQDDRERINIVHVFREQSGERHRISDVGNRCLDANGKPLPTIHTHTDGNCQFSESDLEAIVARGAPFDGIQCGDRYFVWTFAWHILAIMTSAERQKLRGTGITP
jgi:hypothetical protein